MKRLLFILAALLGSSAHAAVNCDIIMRQLDAWGSEVPRVVAVPSGCAGASGIFMYDAASTQPQIFLLDSTLVFTGGTLAVSPTLLSGYATTSALTSGLAGKEPTIAAGTTAQYWRGDKTWQTLPTAVTRSFNYSTRTLNTCFQVSATRDALVSYSVDIATSLSLTAGQQGTVYLRIYTNSGCTTGTQELTRFVNGQTGTLTIGLALTQNVTGTLTGVIPAGSYVQLVTENNTGTPTFTARPGQEVLL